MSNNHGTGLTVGGGTQVFVIDSTITKNRSLDSRFFAAGIDLRGTAEATLLNSIVAGNFTRHTADVRGNFSVVRNSLIGVVGEASGIEKGFDGNLVGTQLAPLDARLGSLRQIGQTFGHPLLEDSPAISAGIPHEYSDFDQAEGARDSQTPSLGALEFRPAYLEDSGLNSNVDHHSHVSFEHDFATTIVLEAESGLGGELISHPQASGTHSVFVSAGQDIAIPFYLETKLTLDSIAAAFNGIIFSPTEMEVYLDGESLGPLSDSGFLDSSIEISAGHHSISIRVADGSFELDNIALNFLDLAVPTIIVEPTAILEPESGEGRVFVEVSLSQPSTATVAARITTLDRKATAGSDYRHFDEVITFAPGETTKIIELVVFADDLDEITESFNLAITPVSNVSVDNDIIAISIVDLPDAIGGSKAKNNQVSTTSLFPEPSQLPIIDALTSEHAVSGHLGTGIPPATAASALIKNDSFSAMQHLISANTTQSLTSTLNGPLIHEASTDLIAAISNRIPDSSNDSSSNVSKPETSVPTEGASSTVISPTFVESSRVAEKPSLQFDLSSNSTLETGPAVETQNILASTSASRVQLPSINGQEIVQTDFYELPQPDNQSQSSLDSNYGNSMTSLQPRNSAITVIPSLAQETRNNLSESRRTDFGSVSPTFNIEIGQTVGYQLDVEPSNGLTARHKESRSHVGTKTGSSFSAAPDSSPAFSSQRLPSVNSDKERHAIQDDTTSHEAQFFHALDSVLATEDFLQAEHEAGSVNTDGDSEDDVSHPVEKELTAPQHPNEYLDDFDSEEQRGEDQHSESSKLKAIATGVAAFVFGLQYFDRKNSS